MIHKFTLFILTLNLCAYVQADTQIETIEQGGERSTITSNGKSARINNSKEPAYMLIDLKQQQFKMIDPQNRQIMLMDIKSRNKAPSANSSNITITLKKVGKGPKIAGYSTEKFNLLANGQLCNTIFGSQSVLKQKGITELFDALTSMQQQTDAMMDGFSSMMDECTLANLKADELTKTTGAPLKVIDANGQVETEVTAITTNAKIPDNYYQIPANYQQISMQQQMNQAQQQMQQNMPDMDQIMQQMQQDGGMSPEAMEQMKKIQEMMQQQMQQ